MENWAKGIGIACALCASLFFWVIAILFEYIAPRSIPATIVITAIGIAFFVWSLILYRKAVHSIGRGAGILATLYIN
jgi:ABC-type Fe3+-siderophore transport system permease subunit